jgi:hypothetical protein
MLPLATRPRPLPLHSCDALSPALGMVKGRNEGDGYPIDVVRMDKQYLFPKNNGILCEKDYLIMVISNKLKLLIEVK